MERRIDGSPMPPVVGDEVTFGWQERHDRYAAAFGEQTVRVTDRARRSS